MRLHACVHHLHAAGSHSLVRLWYLQLSNCLLIFVLCVISRFAVFVVRLLLSGPQFREVVKGHILIQSYERWSERTLKLINLRIAPLLLVHRCPMPVTGFLHQRFVSCCNSCGERRLRSIFQALTIAFGLDHFIFVEYLRFPHRD